MTEGETDSTTKTVAAVRKKADLIPPYGRRHRVLSPILTTKNGVPIVDFRRVLLRLAAPLAILPHKISTCRLR